MCARLSAKVRAGGQQLREWGLFSRDAVDGWPCAAESSAWHRAAPAGPRRTSGHSWVLPLPPGLLTEAWLMQQGGHGWAPPRDEFHLRSLQQLFPWAAEVGAPADAAAPTCSAGAPSCIVCPALPACS